MEFQIYSYKERESLMSIIKDQKLPFKTKIEGIFPQRSVNQNAYGHKLFSIYAEKTGREMLDVKEEMQKKYLLVEDFIEDGNIRYIVRSTAGLNTMEWEQFLEKVRRDAMLEHDIYLPMPDEIFLDEDNLELKLKII